MKALMERASKNLEQEIIRAVVAQTAASLSVQISLMFVPVIGWAISGVVAAVQAFSGAVYDKRTKEVIESAVNAIKERGAVCESRVKAAAESVYQEEFPAARNLALSNESLDGMDGWFSDLRRKTVEVIKQAPKQLKILSDINPIGLTRIALKHGVLKPLESAAKLVESTNIVKEGSLSKPAADLTRNVDRTMKTASTVIVSPGEALRVAAKVYSVPVATAFEAMGQERTADKIRKTSGYVEDFGSSMKTFFTPTGAYNMLSGRESYLAAKEAAEDMRVKAFAQMDAMAADAIAKLRSPEGRAQMRVNIAKAMRNDPAFQAMKAELDALDAAIATERERQDAIQRAALDQLEKGITPDIPSSGSRAGTAVGIAAAVAAALAFT